MANVVIQTGTLSEEYTGDETVLHLRAYVTETFVTAENVTVMKSNFERGDFYKTVVCPVIDGIVTYPEFFLPSNTDAISDPARSKYILVLFTTSGRMVQAVAKRLRIPPTPNPTTLALIAAYSQNNQNPTPIDPERYSNDEIDQLLTLHPTDSEMTAAIQAAVDALVGGAPGALDTLNELAAALNDDANFSVLVMQALVPAGGATGQVLAKSSNANYALAWSTLSTAGWVPTGGTAGQVLTKVNSTDYNFIWAAPATPAGLLPTGGTAGQVLAKVDSDDYDVVWVTPATPAFTAIASQAEAEAGTENTKGMTPLRVAEAIAALGGGGVSALDDLSDVVIAAPTTDEVLKYNGTNWVNAAVPGGGGGAGFNLFSPDVPYGTPSTEDDEFEGASMDAKWTAIGTPTPGFNAPASMLSLIGADTGITGYYQTISGAIVIRAKMHLPGTAVSATTGQIGLFASNAAGTYIKEISARHYRVSAGSNSIDVQVSFRVGRASGDYSTQHYNGTTHTGTQVIYLEIKKVTSGSNYIYDYSYSLDGISFIPCYTQTLTNAIDLVRVGFHTLNSTVAARIDWFRKLQGSYTGDLIAY